MNVKIAKTGYKWALHRPKCGLVMTPDFAERKPEVADLLRKHGGKGAECECGSK